MSLYEQWQNLIGDLSEENFDSFWRDYSAAEIKIYSDILANPNKKISGSFSELAAKYEVDETIFTGFLDGINSSLKKSFDVEKTKHDTALTLSVNVDKLYYNMLVAEAEHLYTLSAWDKLLSEEKRGEIMKEYKKSKIAVKEKTPGRNDPCPCGSGKKYKKCCGKDAS